jgi:N-acetylglucosaminyltransferase
LNATLTVIVPAHNEEEGLPATLEALLRQTESADEIIVVDDGSTDRTSSVAASYGVTVLRPPANLGSKAKAQNYALPHCATDLVLPVDADTVLADDYIEKIKPVFADETVSIAAGTVRTRFQKTVWERGREIEYLFGFHWFRPVQNLVNSPTVCSGCCSVFVLKDLVAFGGFPERTMVEDIDFTWSMQITGRRAVYVADAVAYAAEPTSLTYMRKQLWRWKSGWFQNVRLHYPDLFRHKPMLALWVSLSMLEIIVSPLTLALPVLWLAVFHRSVVSAGEWWVAGESALMVPPLTIAMVKRRVNPLRLAGYYPSYYVLKALNFYYDWKALTVELVLVPLGLAQGLSVYEKGRAHTPGAIEVPDRNRPRSVALRNRGLISIAAGAASVAAVLTVTGLMVHSGTSPRLAQHGEGPPALAAPHHEPEQRPAALDLRRGGVAAQPPKRATISSPASRRKASRHSAIRKPAIVKPRATSPGPSVSPSPSPVASSSPSPVPSVMPSAS